MAVDLERVVFVARQQEGIDFQVWDFLVEDVVEMGAEDFDLFQMFGGLDRWCYFGPVEPEEFFVSAAVAMLEDHDAVDRMFDRSRDLDMFHHHLSPLLDF